jgi:large subunit ribosomal protein L17
MRHRMAHRKLGRLTEHRIAMLRSQALDLLRHERIQTTVPKAKELRPFVERIITIAKRGLAAGEGNGRTLHARRLVLRDIHDTTVVAKLFDTIAPRFAARPGGYTRLLRLGHRRGDAADVAQIELVGSEYNPNAAEDAAAKTAAKPKAKGVGGRLKAAAERLRGRKGESGEESGKEASAQAKASKRAPARRSTTPRKAGGS